MRMCLSTTIDISASRMDFLRFGTVNFRDELLGFSAKSVYLRAMTQSGRLSSSGWAPERSLRGLSVSWGLSAFALTQGLVPRAGCSVYTRWMLLPCPTSAS